MPNKLLTSIYPAIKPFWLLAMDISNKRKSKALRKDLAPVFDKYRETEAGLPEAPAIPKAVWSMWYSEDNLPSLSRLCLKRMKDSLSPLGYEVNILSKDTIQDYVDMSDILPYLEEGKIAIQFYSDVLRTRLLKEYGGFWLDATMAVLDPEELERMRESVPFISFRTTLRPYTANITKGLYNIYFLGTFKGNPLFQFLDEALSACLAKNDGNTEYFLWNYLVRAGYECLPFVKEEIESIGAYYPEAVNQLMLRQVFEKPFDAESYQEIVKEAPLQKLNNKDYGKDGPLRAAQGKETFYGHLSAIWE